MQTGQAGDAELIAEGFELGAVIHRGRRSLIQRATRRSDGKAVVLKAALQGKADRAARRRLRHEHTMLTHAAGRGAVRCDGLATTALGLSLVLDAPPGIALRARVGHARLPIRDFLDLAIQITAALRELHLAGVHHLDLRPENLLSDPTPGGKCVLLDLGRGAKAPIPTMEPTAATTAELKYIAPEQTGRLGRPADGRSDLFSVGVMLYELLAGEPPLAAEDSLEFMYALVALAPRPLDELRPGLPPTLLAIIERLLRKSPDERYQSAGGLLSDLERCRRSLDIRGEVEEFEIGLADRSGQLVLPTRLYGRESNIRELEENVELSTQGLSSGVAVLGAAGIGKSALINSIRPWVARRRGLFASGKFERQAGTDAYGAVVRAIHPILRRLLALPADAVADWKAKLQNTIGARLDALAPLIPLLSSFVEGSVQAREMSPLEAKTRQQGAFADLLRALHDPGSPLVLRIDDVHWADAATLELLEGFLRAPDPGNPVLLLSWRDDELTAAHPLRAMFERVGSDALPRIELQALRSQDVAQMLADTLLCPVGEVAALAEKVTARTSGNPFFIGVLLRALVDAGVIVFDQERMAWHWRLGALDEVEVSDDIVALLTTQLHNRDQASLKLLAQLALFGASIDLGLMALALGQPLEELVDRVAQLGREGILMLDGDGWQFVGELSAAVASESVGTGHTGRGLFVRFPHDKVQAAARDLHSPQEQSSLHWDFGQRLLDLGADGWGDEELFMAAEQLERGRSSARPGAATTTASTALKRAAQAAFASSRFARALRWAEAALEFLPNDAPAGDEFSLHLAAAQAAVVLGMHEARDRHIAAAGPIAPDKFGLVALDRVHIRAELARGEHNAAVDRTLQALERLGISIPRKPSTASVGGLMAKTMWGMRGAAARIRQLPECEDPDVRAAIGLMSEAMIAAYLCEPNLAAVFMLRPVNLTLKHGVTPHSPYGIASYAFLRAAQFHDIEGAQAFAQAAREMVVRLDAKEVAAKVEALVVGFVEARTFPLAQLAERFEVGTRAGLEGGDSTFAAQSAVNAASAMICAGVAIEETEAAILPRMALCRRLGQDRSVEWLALNLQTLDNLRGRAPDVLRIEGEHMQVESWLEVHASGGDQAAPTALHLYTAQLAMWTGHPNTALPEIEAAQASVSTLLGTMYVPLCHAYAGLIRISVARDTGDDTLRRRALKDLKRLQPWVIEGAVNYDHMRQLLRAELADLDGRWEEAEPYYDAAIRLATELGVLHEGAMAMELAGRSWLRRGRGRIAATYLRSALDRWRDYGVTAELERFDHLLAEAAAKGADALAPTGAHDDGEPSHGGVDAEVVRRGAQALVGEIRLESLLKKLLRLAVQVSGATSGSLLLRDKGNFAIAADARLVDGELRTTAVSHLSNAEAPEAHEPLMAVVNLVQRTHESVLISDAHADPRFAEAFEGHAARSVLASPVVRGGELVGVLIAQQELVAGAFSGRHAELVGTLAGQASVSVANSLLYENLQAALKRQEQLTQAYQRFVPAQFVDQLGKESILDVRLGDQVQGEFHVLFADIRGFSGVAERLGPAKTFELINQYLAVMEPAISAHGGYIKEFQGDGVLAVFSGSADDAVSGGLAMHLALAQLNEVRASRQQDALRIGVGINSGRLTFGAIGGISRMASGVVGDAINTASRVEGLCKPYGAGLLISEATRKRLVDDSAYQTRKLDRVVVAGKSEVMDIWEVLDGEPEPLRSGKIASRTAYARGLEAWQEGRFADAAAAFREASTQCPSDRSASLFTKRCDTHAASPPAGPWDGVSRLTWK